MYGQRENVDSILLIVRRKLKTSMPNIIHKNLCNCVCLRTYACKCIGRWFLILYWAFYVLLELLRIKIYQYFKNSKMNKE